MHLETHRYLIRPWTLHDLAALKDLFHDEGFLTYLPKKYHFLKEDDVALKEHLQKRIDDFEKHGFCKFPIFLKNTGELIGTSGVAYFDELGQPELEVGTRLRKAYWRQSVAPEATFAIFKYLRDSLKIEKVYAYIIPTNVQSQNAALKHGFVYLHDLILEGINHKLYVMYLKDLK